MIVQARQLARCGRADWKGVVARAGLPIEAERAVRETVKRTRLSREEKLDIARELCAHFLDGMGEGESAGSLVERFGDERTAAVLLTRSKKRTRHPLRRAMMNIVKIGGALVLVVVGIYAVEYTRFNTAKPNVVRNYIAEYNAQVERIPVEDRAYPLYREAILALYPLSREERVSIGVPYGPPGSQWEEEWNRQVRLILERQEAIELFREGAERPYYGKIMTDAEDPEVAVAMDPEREVPFKEASENPMVIEVLLPDLSAIRTGAQLLMAEARLAAQGGRGEHVVRNLRAVVGMSMHEAPAKTLIEQLVDISIYQHACGTLNEILWAHPDLFDDGQLAELGEVFGAFAGGERYVMDFEFERWMFKDVVQRIYSDNGKGDGHVTAKGIELAEGLMGQYSALPPEARQFVGPVMMQFTADRAELMREFNRIQEMVEERAGMALCERIQVEQEFHAAIDEMAKRYWLIGMLLPAHSRALNSADQAIVHRDAAMALIGAERYRLANGHYPLSIDLLVPEYLQSMPMDQFDCEPLRYEVRNGRPFIWSVGLDQLDNDGEPHLLPNGNLDVTIATRSTGNEIDWILFPPESFWRAQVEEEASEY